MKSSNSKIVIGFATTNLHKLRETQQCFNLFQSAITVVSLPPEEDVEETGKTFEENALIKLHACLKNPIPPNVSHVIAEDAGLIIEALDGKYDISPFPGIYSDRWFTPRVQRELLGKTVDHLTYTEKNQGIIKLLENYSNRKAYYKACVACWCKEINEIITVSGRVDLVVADSPRGNNGFGYDPIMIPVDDASSRTMAELSSDEKNRISHRCNAILNLIPFLQGNPHPA